MNALADDELPFEPEMLDRLAEVSIRVGLNLQPGQDLIITAPVEALPLVRRLAAEAYRNGAGIVTTMLSDDDLALARYEHASDDSLDRAPDWMFKAMAEAFDNNTARLAISKNPHKISLGLHLRVVAVLNTETCKKTIAFVCEKA